MWSIFQAIKRSWTQHFISQATSLIILTLSYGAVLFIALSLLNIQKIFSSWGRVNQLSIYLNPSSSVEAKNELQSFLKQSELVTSSILINSQQSALRFENRFKNISSQEINKEQLATFFPEIIEVGLAPEKAYGQNKVLDDFSASLKQRFSIIANVSYGKNWLERYIKMLQIIKKMGWMLISLFLIGSLFVGASVMRTVLFHKKEEIEILEFVGADDIAIYLPQMLNILCITTLSFCLALLFNYLIFYSFSNGNFVTSSLILKQISFLSPISIAGIFCLILLSVTAYGFLTILQMMPRNQKFSIKGGH